MNKVFTLLAILFVFSFSNAQDLDEVYRHSKENRKNLEYVLAHYKINGESEKYQAAIFLIENMSIHKSVDYKWFDNDYNEIEFSEFDYPDYKIAFQYLRSIKDSIGVRPKKQTKYDLTTISSKLLINNIDAAFFEWKNNLWSKSYSFETFCEYILPYRNLTEPLEDWRGDLKYLVNQPKFKAEETDDPTEVCAEIINGLEDFTFTNKRPDPSYILSPNQMLFRRQASCLNLANFAVLVCRSKGVAATFDFTPHYAASSNRHFWNTVIDKKGNHIPFNSNSVSECKDCLPYLYNANKKRLGKVFRKTFSIQKNTLANLLPKSHIPDLFLLDKNIKDVTEEYVEVGDLHIQGYKLNDSIAYVSVFNLGRWRVIDWSKRTKGEFIFKNLGRDIIYLPTIFKDKIRNYSRYPFLMDEKGVQRELKPETSKTFSANLTRDNELKTNYIDFNTVDIIEGNKYFLKYWDGGWKVIGTSIATNKGVFFENIPSNSLLYLLPEKPDGFERIFIIDPQTNKIFWY